MIAKVISDFLRVVGSWPVYFENDNVWCVRSHTPKYTMQRIASLSALLIPKLKQVERSNQIIQALENINSIYVLEFCTCQLIPYLRFLDTGLCEDLVCPPELQSSISSISQQTKPLEFRLRNNSKHAVATSQLRYLLRAPCVIFAGLVIPIYRVTSSAASSDVVINKTRYRYSPDQVRQLSTVLNEIDKAFNTVVAHSNLVSVNEIKAVSQYLKHAENMTSYFFQPIQKGIYDVIYKDHQYELQRSGGKFILVIGPLQNRINQQCLYVGIPITRKSSSSQLRMRPLRATTLEGFWAGLGVPISPNICLGKTHQYFKLGVTDSTDVETVLDWLDIGVDLATGRTASHMQWRARKNRPPIQKYKQLRRC